MNTIYLIKGTTMGPDGGFPEVPEGTTEWQFSDGPAGRRGSSADYVDLRKGLADHVGFHINVGEANFTPEERAIFDEFLSTP